MRVLVAIIAVGAMLCVIAILGERHQRVLTSYHGASLTFDPGSRTQSTLAAALPPDIIRVKPGRASNSPELVLSSGQSFSGLGPISQILLPFLESSYPEKQGQRAAVLLSASAVLACMFPAFCRKYALLAAIPGAFAFFAQGSGCAICAPFRDGLIAAVPAIGLITLLLVFVILAYSSLNTRILLGIVCLLACVPVVQGVLLIVEPKLCPACIVAGAMCSVIAQGLASSDGLSEIPLLTFAPRLTHAMVALFVVAITRTSLAAINVLPFAHLSVQKGTFVGKQIGTFVHSRKLGRGAYVITNSGCSACDAARIGLRSLSVEITELPACAGVSGDPCFDAGAMSLGTPTFIAVSKQGLVTSQHVGWPDTLSGQADLKKEIENWRNRENR